MHESANGNSAIAQDLNNQFGMKGYEVVVYRKRRKKVSTLYKRYNSVLDSFDDFARIMTEKKKFSHLSETFTHYDYLGWAHGIQRAGYASSRKWATQVLSLINKYKLNTLDENPTDMQLDLAAVDADLNQNK
jgi:flagellum-specific peptidoglycan hydrolase FlgJ